MSTSFLSSIVIAVDVGVPLGFDVLVKLIPLIDTDDDISSAFVKEHFSFACESVRKRHSAELIKSNRPIGS